MILFKKLILAAAFFGITTITIAQQAVNDSIISSTRTVQNYTSIRVQGDFEVYVTQGNSESLKMEGPSYLVNDIVTEVHGSELNVKLNRSIWPWKENSWFKKSRAEWNNHNWNNGDNWNHKKVTVYITAKKLDALKMSGSGHLFFNDGVTTTNLKLRVRGSGQIEGVAQANTITSRISGNGHIKLSGSAENSKVRISGSGNFSASKLVTTNSSVHVSGSGHADVNANKEVSASVRGSAHVGYTGNATNINTSKSGSGTISKM